MTLPVAMIPPGSYAVACSGGADSVALLLACEAAGAGQPHVVHLNHQTRGAESDADAAFVEALARRLLVPYTVATLADVLPELRDRPANASALYRAARLALFARVCRQHGLSGVLLAHHADDQAETVLHRLLRGSGAAGLGGMSAATTVGGVRVLRPLLGVRRHELRDYLRARGQGWRDDPSNASDRYFRNRLRKLLAARPELVPVLLELGRSARDLRAWAEAAAPALPPAFRVEALHALPGVLARVSARRWLAERGVPAAEIEPPVLERLLRLAADAASPPAVNLPTNLTARRTGGVIAAAATGRPPARSS
jgi:tRNA(Ile)-lysidine synthase